MAYFNLEPRLQRDDDDDDDDDEIDVGQQTTLSVNGAESYEIYSRLTGTGFVVE